jgi:cytochrome c553
MPTPTTTKNQEAKMKPQIVMLCVLSLLTSGAVQASEPGFEWNRANLKLIASGDAAKGKKLAKKQKCAKCHGEVGLSEEDDTPSIAGQTRAYQFKQMMDYKSGVREEKGMSKAMRKLTPEQMADLAAFFASQPADVPPERKVPALATVGDEKRLLIACDRCHGEKGKGYGYESPVLRGQRPEYLVDTMTEFREGDRENDDYQRMRFIASQLTEEEIEQLAEYYSVPAPEEEE